MSARYHVVTVKAVQNGRETDYVAQCHCGWESLPTHDKADARRQPCEVFAAELEGAKRRARRLGFAKSA